MVVRGSFKQTIRGWPLALAIALVAALLVVAPAAAFNQAGSAESGITSGTDGNLWAAFAGQHALYQVAVSGQITSVNTGTTEGPLAASADGNLWTGEETRGIARISPSGQEADFAPPASFVYQPGGMAVGPDGNVWFTSGYVNGFYEVIRVSRITPSGQVTEFPIPLSLVPGITHANQSELAPREIAVGAGALWLLSERGLVRLTTDGQMSFLPVPPTGATHAGLAYGPDGNLWATYATPTLPNGYPRPTPPTPLQVRRISPTGAVSAVPIPGVHTGLGAVGITSGPDGNLWVADGSRILRITPPGAVTEFPTGLPPGDQAEAITVGPDGNIWFTGSPTAIGRITLSGQATVFPLPGVVQPQSISHPPARCVVPNLRRKTLAQAKKLLVRAHCTLGRVTRSKRHTRRKQVVTGQAPRVKTIMNGGSRVNVTLGVVATRGVGASAASTHSPVAHTACRHFEGLADRPCVVGNIFGVCDYYSCEFNHGGHLKCKVGPELGRRVTHVNPDGVTGTSWIENPHKTVACKGSATILKAYVVTLRPSIKFHLVQKHGTHSVVATLHGEPNSTLYQTLEIMAQR